MSAQEFNDHHLAALYDVFFPPEKRDDLRFYLPMIMSARSVLDVGCGTGALLHWARERGHTGRLCGLDPAEAMLEQARRRSDIEWVHGDLTSVRWESEFDLIIMTGHAFQELREDAEIRAALAAIRAALRDDGRFAFETRNPLDRGWERWQAQYTGEVADRTGAVVRCTCRVDLPIQGEIVHHRLTYTSAAWVQPRVSNSALRFISEQTLAIFLAEAGLRIGAQFGDWDRSPLTPESPEIITIAQRS